MAAQTDELQEIEQRRRRARTLWTIEVTCKNGNEVVRREIRNRFSSELMQLRETFFSAGFAYQLDSRTWLIVPPRDILQVKAMLQNKFDEREY